MVPQAAESSSALSSASQLVSRPADTQIREFSDAHEELPDAFGKQPWHCWKCLKYKNKLNDSFAHP